MIKTDLIPFNKPYLSGNEFTYMQEALKKGKISGDGHFTHACHRFFKEQFGFEKPLLTTSCTDALEMAAILANISPGDEVIVPSFTFPSTATAFVLRGARTIFADSGVDNPNIDVSSLEELITEKTKAIVPVHYAGVACEMDAILSLAQKHNLIVVEDAAQAIDSKYKGRILGQIGHFGTFSFHETKNISSGEGGMLAVNAAKYHLRAEIIREKGTNRSAFFRGEVNKYGWVDIGSSFLPSDLIAAFLLAQLESLGVIQARRIAIWNLYRENLAPLEKEGRFSLPHIPSFATNNAHLFYLLCHSVYERQNLIRYLKSRGILAIFHYIPLHSSPFYKDKHGTRPLPNCDRYSDCLLRLPLYCDLTDSEVHYIIDAIYEYFRS